MAIRATFAFLSLLLGPVLMGHASAAEPEMTEVRQILAPTGALRVALYPGTPTSVVSATDLRGVGYELGKSAGPASGRWTFKPVIFAKNADVLDAIKTGTADVAFTNCLGAARRRYGFHSALSGDRTGFSGVGEILHRDGIGSGPSGRAGRGLTSANSSSDATLSHDLEAGCKLVRAETVASGIQMLAAGGLDVYATNKATLFEMADRLPGARILDGSWGMERHAFAHTQGTAERGLGYARAFVADVVASGLVTQAADRAGLRGAVAGPPP